MLTLRCICLYSEPLPARCCGCLFYGNYQTVLCHRLPCDKQVSRLRGYGEVYLIILTWFGPVIRSGTDGALSISSRSVQTFVCSSRSRIGAYRRLANRTFGAVFDLLVDSACHSGGSQMHFLVSQYDRLYSHRLIGQHVKESKLVRSASAGKRLPHPEWIRSSCTFVRDTQTHPARLRRFITRTLQDPIRAR